MQKTVRHYIEFEFVVITVPMAGKCLYFGKERELEENMEKKKQHQRAKGYSL
jgi:hypothetical protein